jgi:hypothetical protein
MINDINIGGVFIPGLLLTALIALVCTLLLVPLFLSAGFTGVCPCARCLMSQPISDLFPAFAGPDHTGVIRMKPLLSLLGRYALTLIAVAVATFVAFIFWKQYAQTPWTRDGRVRADVVQIAPDVSGPVSSVAVRDNQWVNQGDVLYAIDPRWLKLAVLSAQADVEAKRHEMLMRQDAARRRALIKGVISGEDIQQTGSAARVAAANYQGRWLRWNWRSLIYLMLPCAHRLPATSRIFGFAQATTPPWERQRSPLSMRTVSGWWAILKRPNCVIFVSGTPHKFR